MSLRSLCGLDSVTVMGWSRVLVGWWCLLFVISCCVLRIQHNPGIKYTFVEWTNARCQPLFHLQICEGHRWKWRCRVRPLSPLHGGFPRAALQAPHPSAPGCEEGSTPESELKFPRTQIPLLPAFYSAPSEAEFKKLSSSIWRVLKQNILWISFLLKQESNKSLKFLHVHVTLDRKARPAGDLSCQGENVQRGVLARLSGIESWPSLFKTRELLKPFTP